MDKKRAKELEEELKMRQGNISLILDSYDDLFSDFDPRPNGVRALSEDFLDECMKAARSVTNDEPELRLQLPAIKRNSQMEDIIRQRLKNHFDKHHIEYIQERRKEQMKGVAMILLGALLLVSATLIEEKDFWTKFILVILEPAGWFSMWEGLYGFIFPSEEKRKVYSFYEKMSNVKVEFFSY